MFCCCFAIDIGAPSGRHIVGWRENANATTTGLLNA